MFQIKDKSGMVNKNDLWINKCYVCVFQIKDKSGIADFELDYEKLVGKATIGTHDTVSISVSASVKESLTGVVLNGSGSLNLHKTGVKIEILSSTTANFKPGLRYPVFVSYHILPNNRTHPYLLHFLFSEIIGRGKPPDFIFLASEPRVQHRSQNITCHGGQAAPKFYLP